MSSLVGIDNRGFPPLAGFCDYDTAARPGSVDDTVARLKRYNHVLRRLHEIGAAHLPATPEWEVKCALSLHLWVDAEHATLVRARVAEMREPPLQLDEVPVRGWRPRARRRSALTGRRSCSPASMRSSRRPRRRSRGHVQMNPLFDHPTYRLLRAILREQEEVLSGGRGARAVVTAADREQVDQFRAHVRAYLSAAGGISAWKSLLRHRLFRGHAGMGSHTRWTPNRVATIASRSVQYDGKDRRYAADESLPADERTWALAYKRLREMDVPEMMAPIIHQTRGKPWEYYRDLARQLWDEARHAMMGEVCCLGRDPVLRLPDRHHVQHDPESRVHAARGARHPLEHRAGPDAAQDGQALRVGDRRAQRR